MRTGLSAKRDKYRKTGELNLMKDPINMIITGVGGQGNVLAAKLFAAAALEDGWEVSVGDVYGLSQRGGSVASHIRCSRENTMPPLIPEGSLDLLLAFEPLEALRIQTQYGNMETSVVTNNQPVAPIGVQAGRFAYPDINEIHALLKNMSRQVFWIPGTEIAKDLGNIQLLNTVMTGALFAAGQVVFQAGLLEDQIHKTIPQGYVPKNIDAFRQGQNALAADKKITDPGRENA